MAVLMGWALLGDVPPALALAGGVLCLVGVAITRGVRLGAAGRRRGAGRELAAQAAGDT
jgi:drug/metabolite transporter (DMT)-like permease